MQGTNQRGAASSFLLIVVSSLVSFLMIISPVIACAITHSNNKTSAHTAQATDTANLSTTDNGEGLYNEEPLGSNAEANANNTPNTSTNTNANPNPDSNAALTTPNENEKERINFLILGLDDDDIHTDVMMAASFETATGAINVISIPRDTRVKIRDDIYNTLKSENRYVPSSGYAKINELHNYGGSKYGIQFAQMQVETLLGIEFDFYVRINLDAFAYIVDSIGGITLTIPEGGMKTRNPEKYLEIDLREGTWTLNGAEAEHFVRMREIYLDADLGRIRNQHIFLTEFIKQALQKETIINNLYNYAYTLFNHIKTDFSIDDVPKYAKYLKLINAANMTLKTMPGRADDLFGGSYYFCDEEKTAALVAEMFYGQTAEQTAE